MSLVDMFFPKQCVVCKKIGEYLCANCFTGLSFDTTYTCLVCNGFSIDGLSHPRCQGKYTIDGAFCGFAYKRGIKKLIYTFKYQPYLSDLGKFSVQLLHEGLIQQEAFISIIQIDSPVLIPVPLSSSKFRKRGYNQAKILADELSKLYAFSVIDCLDRTKDTKPQFGLKKEERKENIKDAFMIKKSFQRKKDTISAFLVDDLLTTGTTLLEAANVLKRNGFEKVWGICLARDE